MQLPYPVNTSDALGPRPTRRPVNIVDAPNPEDAPPVAASAHHVLIVPESGYRRSPEFLAGLNRARRRARRAYWYAVALPGGYILAAVLAFWWSGGHPVP